LPFPYSFRDPEDPIPTGPERYLPYGIRKGSVLLPITFTFRVCQRPVMNDIIRNGMLLVSETREYDNTIIIPCRGRER